MANAMETVHFSRPYNWSDLLYKFHRKNDERPFGTDVDVMCKGGYIPVHSWVLMASSDMLKEHFMAQSRSEREHMVVHLPDYDIVDVTPVIYLFYTGMCLIPRKRNQLILEIIESLGVSTTSENLRFVAPCNEDLKHKCSIRRYLDCDDEEISLDEEDELLTLESNLSSETVAVQNVVGVHRNKVQNSSPPAQSSSSSSSSQKYYASNSSSFCQPGPSSTSKSINKQTDSMPSSKGNIVVPNGNCGNSSIDVPLTMKSKPEPKIARAVKVMRDGNTVKLIHAGDSGYSDTSKVHNHQNNSAINNDNIENSTTSNQNNDQEEEEEEDVEKETTTDKNKKSKKRHSQEKNNKQKLASDSEREDDDKNGEEDEDEEDDTNKKSSLKSTTNKRKITTKISPQSNKRSKRHKKSDSPVLSDKSQDEDEDSSEEENDESVSEAELGEEEEDDDKSESPSDVDSESSLEKEKILCHGTRTRPVRKTRGIRKSSQSNNASTSPQIKHRLRTRRNNSKNTVDEDEEEEDDDDEASDYGSKTSNSKRVSTRQRSIRKPRKCTKSTGVKCPICKSKQDTKFLRYHIIKTCGANLNMNIDTMKCKNCDKKFPSLSLVEFVSHVKKCKPGKEDSDEDEEEEDVDKDEDGESDNDKENGNEDASSETSESSDSGKEQNRKGKNRKRKNKSDSDDDSCYDKEEHRSKDSTSTSPLNPSENIDSGDIEIGGSDEDVEAEECLTFYEAYVSVERLPDSEVEKHLAKYLKSLEVHENDNNRRLSSAGSQASTATWGTGSTKSIHLNNESQTAKTSDKNKNTKETENVSSKSQSVISTINTSKKTVVTDPKTPNSQTQTATTSKQTISRETKLKRAKTLFENVRTCPTCKKGFNNCKFAMHCLLTHRLRRCWICLQTFNDSPTNDENHFQSKHSLGQDKKDLALCPICENEVPWKNIQKHITTEHFQDLLNDNKNETRPLSKEPSTSHNQETKSKNNDSNKNVDDDDDDDEEDEEENAALPRLKIKDPALLFESDDEDKTEESSRSISTSNPQQQQQPVQKGVQQSNESNQRLPVYVAENLQQQSRQLNPTHAVTNSTTITNPASIISSIPSETNRQRVAATIPNRTPPLSYTLRGQPPQQQQQQQQPLMSATVSGELRSGSSAVISGTVYQQHPERQLPHHHHHHQSLMHIPPPRTSAPINYNNNNNSYNTTSSSPHSLRPNTNSAHFNNQNQNNTQNYLPRLTAPANPNSFHAVNNNNNSMGRNQQQEPNPEAIADNIRNLLYNTTRASAMPPQSSPGITNPHSILSSAPVCLSSNNAPLLVPARGGVNSVVLSSRNLPVTNPQSAVALPTHPGQQQQQQQQHRNPSNYHHSQQQPPIQQQVYPHQQQQQQQQFYNSSNAQNNNNNNMAIVAANNLHMNNRNVPPPLSNTGNSATYFGKTMIAGVPFKVYQRPENSVPHPDAVCSISTTPTPTGFLATSVHSVQDANRQSMAYPDSNINMTTTNNNNQVNQNLTYPSSTTMIASTSTNINENSIGGSTTTPEIFSCRQCDQYFSCASSLAEHMCFSLD